jgi:hypothetical protein
MPQFLLVVLLLAVVVIAAYFYLKRAQSRTAAPTDTVSPEQSGAASTPEVTSDPSTD